MSNVEFMIITPGKLSSSVCGQLEYVRIDQELKAEGSSISVSMSENANSRARNKEMCGVLLTSTRI